MGLVRVKVCDGSWLLEPQAGGKTKATYMVYTDTGGSLPAFVANATAGLAIRKVFAAVRNQVKDPKYRSDRDFLETEPTTKRTPNTELSRLAQPSPQSSP